ncbi:MULTISPECIES: glutaredoxin family protein [unclassified Arthrobacter]|uniref:glutaredoxin family protein n=1 Tax=unclassified Arthrobacter TaxID=235627 RepID=UPI0002D38A4A|nr:MULTISPECIES: glutaredoxin family protein [unclassified Arthrobacter]
MVSPPRPEMPTDGAVSPVVELLTKPDCHLCAAARAVVAAVCEELGVPWHELSTVDAPDLLERFAEEIPVLLIDGVQRDFWKIDEARLRRLLTQ